MKSYPEQDLEDEREFPEKLAAPITESLSYGFTAEKVTLASEGGKSVDVVRVRPTSAWTGKRTAASEKPFTPKYHRGRANGVPKNLICLHFTAGGFRGSLGALVKDGRLVGVPFLIGRTGTIYELHEDELWGNNSHRANKDQETVAIEIINVGPIVRGDDAYYRANGKGGRLGPYCGLDEEDLVQHLPVPYRGFSCFATYTNEQYDALVKLLAYLTDKYDIPYEFLPIEKRFDKGAVASGWRGIASHVNFWEEGKWDIGPAFDWDRLTQRSLSLPVEITRVGGAPAPAPAGGSPPPPDKIAAELQVTRAALDRLYAHTETDTANKGGSYPVGLNTLWHGGVHLFVDGAGVHACLDGQIVAARLRTPALEGGQRPEHYGSAAFILVRHTLDLGLIGQLDKLLVPQAYTVQKPGTAAPGIDFQPAAPFPDAQFCFEPGDVFERTDDEDARPPRSEKAACPARVKSLVDFIEHVQGFEVRNFLEKNGSHTPVLTVTSPAGQPAFPLRRGDQLRLLDRPANTDLRRRALKKGTDYEVELVGLGDEMATARRYLVKSTWFLGFRTEEGASPPEDTEPTADEGRHPDLAVGDVLEAVNPDLSVEGEPEGEIEVEVVALGAAGKDIESIPITKGLVRLLLSGSGKEGEQVLKLVAGDELTMVQREARVEGKKLDLVQLAALAAEPQVADVGATGTVKAKKLALLEDPKKGAKVVATLSRRATFTVTQADAFPWIEIESGDETGFIEYKKDKVDLPLVGRDEASWTTALVGQSFFVKAFTDGELKAATPAAERKLAVGTKGWIQVPAKGLEASGDSRRVKHAEKIGYRGRVPYDPALMEPTGRNRLALYGSVVGTAGQLSYDAGAMVEIRGVRRPLAQLAGKPFYSLYMHLDDKAPLTQDALKDVAWFPREVSALRLKQPATWQPEKGPAVPLVAGDKLRPERPWLTDETPALDQKFVWEEIQEGDIVTGIEVKATKAPIFLHGPNRKERLTLLMPGDRLVPVNPAAAYKKNEWVEVRVEKLHAWQTRRAAPSGQKRNKLWNDNGTAQIGFYTPKEDLTEMGAQGGRSYVRVMARKNPTGWTPTKNLGPVTGPAAGAPATGFIKWSAEAFTPEVEKRTAVFGEHKGARGTVVVGLEAILSPRGADREQAPSRAIIARLEKAEVVTFPLAVAGSSTTTRVKAADPLWKSGTYAPVLPRETPTGPRGKLIHWEIFSEENLLPSRPFRPDDKELWKKIGWPFWEVSDPDGDWTMDCQEILALVAKGVPEGEAEQDREKLTGEILNPKEIESLYTQPDVAAKLRHLAARFTLEWAVDARTGLRKMKSAELDQAWWGKLGQRFTGGPREDWSQHVDAEWADRQARYFAPMLWWRAPRDGRGGGMPGSLVWHYNPIAFLDAFCAVDLAKQKAKEEAAAKAAKAKEEAAKAKAAAKKK